LLQLGARSVYDRGEADEQFSEGIDGTFVPWLLNLKTRLLKEYPLPEGIQPVPDDVNIEPKWVLELADLNGDYAGLDLPRPQPSQDEPPPDFIPILGGITATVHSNNRLTPQSHFQDTRHLILTLSGNHQYEPGATVTIYPKNFPSDVNDFIKWMEWDSIADKPLKFVSTRASLSSALPIPNLDLNNTTPLTLRTLLTNHLDIMSIPRRSFFTHLLQHTSNPMHQERLLEFLAPEYIDELYDYTTRPRRSILEVLSDISSVRLPWQTVCDVIPALRGRQFSIASGGVLKSPTTTTTTTTDDGEREGTGQTEAVAATAAAGHEQATSTRVDLLVAIVRYRTIIRRVRHGVATRYIATLRPGQALRVTLQPSALGFVPTAAAAADLLRRPVVMIAPGTGVAPMRSLAWERKMLRERHRSRDADAVAIPDAERWGCKDVLFFGCRKKGVDEYFRDEWDEKELGVDVFTAWSQEQVSSIRRLLDA
jgi:sulfite reductase alpha subunit-like flavoprotein